MQAEQRYLELLRLVRESGRPREDRTGTGTLALFGHQARYDLRGGFPLLTTKRVHWRSVVGELLWFIRGETNIRSLQADGVSIWDEWADAEGELGPVYGHQWRHWQGTDGRVHDQLAEVIARIRREPDSRRLLVSAWNAGEIDRMALAPCHVLFQFHVAEGELSCQVYQRSADVFLGVPFNIASYALLTHLVAQVTGLAPGDLVHTLGDTHLYRNHLVQADTQLTREPRPAPRLRLAPDIHDIDAFQSEHILLDGYDPHPPIPAPVAV